jgi:hypothetical protein
MEPESTFDKVIGDADAADWARQIIACLIERHGEPFSVTISNAMMTSMIGRTLRADLFDPEGPNARVHFTLLPKVS